MELKVDRWFSKIVFENDNLSVINRRLFPSQNGVFFLTSSKLFFKKTAIMHRKKKIPSPKVFLFNDVTKIKKFDHVT